MKNKNPIRVSKEQRAEMVSQIKEYYAQERGEEIGDLAAGLILDFIQEELAPVFYNQGVSDAQKYMHDAAEDLLSIQK